MAKTDFSKVNSAIQKAAEKKQKFANGEGFKKFEKVEWMKLPFGDTTFMVLPPTSDEVDFYHEVYIHHNFVDPVNPDKKRSYQCSKKTHGSCPICDHVDNLTKQGLTKEAAQLRGQRTFLYNVMDSEGNVKVAPLKPSMHTEVMQEINTNYIDNDVDVTDPANGKLIKLSRLKAAPWARARVLGKNMEISNNKLEEVISKLKDLSKVYIDNTPEELERVLNGEEVNFKTKAAEGEGEEEGGSAETESTLDAIKETAKPAPAAAKPAAKPAAAPAKAAPAAKTEAPKAAPAKAAAPAAKAAPKAEAATESTGDDELDAMLEDLGID